MEENLWGVPKDPPDLNRVKAAQHYWVTEIDLETKFRVSSTREALKVSSTRKTVSHLSVFKKYLMVPKMTFNVVIFCFLYHFTKNCFFLCHFFG